MFSIDLGYKGQTNEQESYIIFGGLNQSAYVGDLMEFPLVEKNAIVWAIEINGFINNGVNMLQSVYKLEAAVAVVDSGTTYMTVPALIHKQLVQEWTSMFGNDQIECTTVCFVS
jgi:hypothetical protein